MQVQRRRAARHLERVDVRLDEEARACRGRRRVSKFVTVASQMSRPSYDVPMLSTGRGPARSSAQPWRISVSSSYR